MDDITAAPRVRRAVDGDVGRAVGGWRPRWTEAFSPDLSPGWTPVVHHYTGIRPRAHRRPSTELSPDVGEAVVVCERSATENWVMRMTGNSREPRAAQSEQRCVTVLGDGPRDKGGSSVDECTGCVGERRPRGPRDTVAGPVGAPPRHLSGAAVWAGLLPCGQVVGRPERERLRVPTGSRGGGSCARWSYERAGVGPRTARGATEEPSVPLSPCCGGRAA
jgi:hypothetical protein